MNFFKAEVAESDIYLNHDDVRINRIGHTHRTVYKSNRIRPTAFLQLNSIRNRHQNLLSEFRRFIKQVDLSSARFTIAFNVGL